MFYAYLEIIPIYGQLGLKQEALEAWRGLLKKYPGASAETFANWWRLWNIHDDEVARLMEGVYKSGVLGANAGRPAARRRLDWAGRVQSGSKTPLTFVR